MSLERGGGGSGYYGDEEIQAGRKVSRGLAPPFLLPPTCPLLSPNPSTIIQVMQGLMKLLTLTLRPSSPPFAGFLPSQRLFEVLLRQQPGPPAQGRRCGSGSLTRSVLSL